MKRAAAYIRQSNEHDKEKLSLDVQEREIREYAEEQGYDLAPRLVFVEQHTGVHLFERKELMRMLERLRAGEFDVLILWATDRFSREPAHLSYLLVEAQQAGVVVEFVREQLDASDERWLIRQVMGYAAKREWMRKKETTYAGKKRSVERRKPILTGRPLYGYRARADRRGYDINEETAPGS